MDWQSFQLFPGWFVLLWFGAISALVALVVGGFWLADKGWYALCRVLQRRGWAISADEPPSLTNL